MKPRPFKEMTKILTAPLGEPDQEIEDLPVFRDGRQIISCWKLSPWDRIKALCFGRVWLGVWGKTTSPPVRLDVCRTIFGRKEIP